MKRSSVRIDLEISGRFVQLCFYQGQQPLRLAFGVFALSVTYPPPCFHLSAPILSLGFCQHQFIIWYIKGGKMCLFQVATLYYILRVLPKSHRTPVFARDFFSYKDLRIIIRFTDDFLEACSNVFPLKIYTPISSTMAGVQLYQRTITYNLPQTSHVRWDKSF